MRHYAVQQPSAKTKKSDRHNLKIMPDIFFIYCWPTSYCTEVISNGPRAAPFIRLIAGTKKA